MPFRYLRDPLFLFCLALYFANRFLFVPLVPLAFFHEHLNDVICIPFWVPIMLFIMRKCRMRRDDGPPASYEIVIPLILWSIIFELWLPFTSLFRGLAYCDYLDVLSYTCGAFAAAVFWRVYYRQRKAPA